MQARLFMGILVSSELRLFLDQSVQWKEDVELNSSALQQLNYNKSAYIGFYIPSLLPLMEVYEKEKQLKNQLQVYCSKINLETLNCKIFSQILIG